MIERRKTRTVRVGGIPVGANAPIVIQSMTKVPTTDIDAVLAQIADLQQAGCRLIRLAVPTAADTKAFAKIAAQTDAVLIADVHFAADRAVESLEAGGGKVRLNPGNIKNTADIHRIIDAAKKHDAAVRIGVNEASIRPLRSGGDVPPAQRVALMLDEMQKYVQLFEKRGFNKIILSAKSADVPRTIEVNRALAGRFDYPLHLGLTHAGLPEDAETLSAVALGCLVAEGIGDTIRVSAAGSPVLEVDITKKILSALDLYPRPGVTLVVCPTCGRAEVDVVSLARRVKKALANVKKNLRIAVMGCVVNGPGEAADADVAVCCGKGKAFLYRHGKRLTAVPEEKIFDALLTEIDKL